MKIALFILFISFANLNFAQDKGTLNLRGGVTYFNDNILFGPGLSFQFELFKKLIAGLDFDYHKGASNSNVMIFQPKFVYYTNSNFNGLNFGGFFGVNFTGDRKLFDPNTRFEDFIGFAGSYGLIAGYSHEISRKFYADLSCNAGLIYLKELSKNSLYLKPQISIGYKFN